MSVHNRKHLFQILLQWAKQQVHRREWIRMIRIYSLLSPMVHNQREHQPILIDMSRLPKEILDKLYFVEFDVRGFLNLNWANSLFFFVAFWATRQTEKDIRKNKDLYVKTTIRELIVYLVFICILCIGKFIICFSYIETTTTKKNRESCLKTRMKNNCFSWFCVNK